MFVNLFIHLFIYLFIYFSICSPMSSFFNRILRHVIIFFFWPWKPYHILLHDYMFPVPIYLSSYKSFFRSFSHSFIHSYIYSFIHLIIFTVMHWFVRWFCKIHSSNFIHSSNKEYTSLSKMLTSAVYAAALVAGGWVGAEMRVFNSIFTNQRTEERTNGWTNGRTIGRMYRQSLVQCR